tara:strand:+ start:169 stop:600 length:432 start_codon:yes stop_codon:yes gene_type:complete
MADLNPTEASVTKLSTGVSTKSGTMEASTSCLPAQLILKNDAGTYILASNATIAAADLVGNGGGMAVSIGTAGKNVDFINKAGTEVELGISVTENTWFAVSANAGNIAALGDVASGKAIQYVGYGNSSNKFVYYPIKTNTTKS